MLLVIAVELLLSICRRNSPWNELFRTIFRMPLNGRDAELAEIDDLFGRVEAGAGGTLVITGPAGVGKTALAHWAVDRAAARGWQVLNTAAPRRQTGLLVWARLLRATGDSESSVRQLLDTTDPVKLDDAAATLARGRGPRLLVVDDIDRAGGGALDLLSLLDTRLVSTSTAAIVISGTSLGIGQELRLGGLDRQGFAMLTGIADGETLDAAWLATRGLPQQVHGLLRDLRGLPGGTDPLVHLALRAVSNTFFLEADAELVRLLEMALDRADAPEQRALLLAGLARELLGDPSALSRRRELIDEALKLARACGNPRVLAEVLDARLHALWDPASAEDRLTSGAEIHALAVTVGDAQRERQGVFWRFIALMQLGRLSEAESVLARYLQLARAAGDAAATTMGVARQAMLAILRGRFDEARAHIEEVTDLGRRARVADLDALVGTLRGGIMRDCGSAADAEAGVDELLLAARRAPGHFYEATAAGILVRLGKLDAAEVELDRMLPRLLAGTGPRWLAATADLAVVAAAVGDQAAAERLYAALLPFDGQLVVQGGANLAGDPVALDLGLAAVALGQNDVAILHLSEAYRFAESIGALPAAVYSARALAAALCTRGGSADVVRAHELARHAEALAERLGMVGVMTSADQWFLTTQGEDWLLVAGTERARMRDSRGLHHLRLLLSAPGQEVAALDLVSDGLAAPARHAAPMLDDTARLRYRARLVELTAELDEADQIGDVGRAVRASAERDALVEQLRRGVGLGGRPRAIGDEAERARVNVTRALRRAIDAISAVAPLCGAHLESTIRTGRMCRYVPAGSGPRRWRV